MNNKPLAWCSVYPDGSLNWLQRFEDKNHKVALYAQPTEEFLREHDAQLVEKIATMTLSTYALNQVAEKIRKGEFK